jgi:hypothetical protein
MVDVLSLLLHYNTRLIFAYRENADYTRVNRYISVNKECLGAWTQLLHCWVDFCRSLEYLLSFDKALGDGLQ